MVVSVIQCCRVTNMPIVRKSDHTENIKKKLAAPALRQYMSQSAQREPRQSSTSALTHVSHFEVCLIRYTHYLKHIDKHLKWICMHGCVKYLLTLPTSLWPSPCSLCLASKRARPISIAQRCGAQTTIRNNRIYT